MSLESLLQIRPISVGLTLKSILDRMEGTFMQGKSANAGISFQENMKKVGTPHFSSSVSSHLDHAKIKCQVKTLRSD